LDEIPERHRAFAEVVRASRLQDPRGTFENLSKETGIPVEDLIHHALTRWAAAGSEALMATPPQVLRELKEARDREDWDAVAGLIDWLASGDAG
jgi:N-glycosylase/DNA lyase